MADIFISYASADRPRAKALAEAIEHHGWDVWWDRKIPLGKSWDQVIEEQIDKARCVIVLWSKESILSTWVKTEAREGKARGILIPVLIDDVKIPLEFRHIQAANLTEWQPEAQSAEYDRLLTDVDKLLGSRPTVGRRPRDIAQRMDELPAESPRPQREKSATSPAMFEEKYIEVTPAETNVNLQHTLGGMGPVRSMVFSLDGATLTVLWGDRSAWMCRVSDGKLLSTLKGEGHEAWHTNYGVAFSPEGAILATTPDPTTVLLWSVSDGKLLRMLKGHTGLINALAFSPDGTKLASASDDKTVRLWEVRDGTHLMTLQGNAHWVKCVAFSPQGDLLASGAQVIISLPELKIWSVSDGKPLNNLTWHTDTILSVAFSPDGTVLASGSEDRTVRLWQVEDGTLLHTLTGHSESVMSIAFSPNGTIIATGSQDKNICIWSLADGALLHTLAGHGAPVTCVAFSSDGETLASGSSDHTVRIWSLKIPSPD